MPYEMPFTLHYQKQSESGEQMGAYQERGDMQEELYHQFLFQMLGFLLSREEKEVPSYEASEVSREFGKTYLKFKK